MTSLLRNMLKLHSDQVFFCLASEYCISTGRPGLLTRRYAAVEAEDLSWRRSDSDMSDIRYITVTFHDMTDILPFEAQTDSMRLLKSLEHETIWKWPWKEMVVRGSHIRRGPCQACKGYSCYSDWHVLQYSSRQQVHHTWFWRVGKAITELLRFKAKVQDSQTPLPNANVPPTAYMTPLYAFACRCMPLQHLPVCNLEPLCADSLILLSWLAMTERSCTACAIKTQRHWMALSSLQLQCVDVVRQMEILRFCLCTHLVQVTGQNSPCHSTTRRDPQQAGKFRVEVKSRQIKRVLEMCSVFCRNLRDSMNLPGQSPLNTRI